MQPEILAKWFERYREDLTRTLVSRLHLARVDEVDDAVQDVSVYLLRKWKALSERLSEDPEHLLLIHPTGSEKAGPFLAWVSMCVWNRLKKNCHQKYRGRTVWGLGDEESGAGNLVDSLASPDEADPILSQESIEGFKACWGKLTGDQQAGLRKRLCERRFYLPRRRPDGSLRSEPDHPDNWERLPTGMDRLRKCLWVRGFRFDDLMDLRVNLFALVCGNMAA